MRKEVEPSRWFARWTGVAGEHRTILRGIVWVSAFVVLGKLIGAAKEMAVAWRYGTSTSVDAYLFVFNLMTWPVSVGFSALFAVLVPLLIRSDRQKPAHMAFFWSELLGTTLLIGAVLGLAIAAALQAFLTSTWVPLPASVAVVAATIVWPMALVLPIGLLAGLLSARMLAHGQHSNTLLEGLPAAGILCALLVWPVADPTPLVWGTLGGFVLQVALLAGLSRGPTTWKPVLGWHSPQWQHLWRGLGMVFGGQALMSMNVLVDQFSAMHLSAGSIATLNYANRILALLIGIGVTAVSRATLPVFANTQMNDPERAYLAAFRWVRLLFAAGLLTIGVGWYAAPTMVRLLFENGAFSPSDTMAVAQVLRYGLLQLPFYFSGIVLLSFLSAQGRYASIAAICTVCLAVKILGNLWLTPLAGLVGIQWSTGLMYAVFLGALYLLTRHQRGNRPTSLPAQP